MDVAGQKLNEGKTRKRIKKRGKGAIAFHTEEKATKKRVSNCAVESYTVPAITNREMTRDKREVDWGGKRRG